jgi:hypothetical protein
LQAEFFRGAAAGVEPPQVNGHVHNPTYFRHCLCNLQRP